MKLEVNFNLDSKGHLIVEDASKYYDYYIPEYYNYKNYSDKKYSESQPLLIVVKKDASGDTSKDKIYKMVTFKHINMKRDIDTLDIQFNEDGYYILYYFIIPTETWIKSVHNPVDHLDYVFYINRQGDIIYRFKDNLGRIIDEIIDPKDLISYIQDTVTTNVDKKVKKVFPLSKLWCCYYSYAKQLFDILLQRCPTQDNANQIYKRDFIFMTINIIKYLLDFDKYFEAQRILDLINGCGGFCNSIDKLKGKSDCGCSKK